jgi:Ca-activated chloride channel family protein
MGDPASDEATKLDLAKDAAIAALDDFKDSDEVGFWVFTTDMGGADPNVTELVPISPIGDDEGQLESAIARQFPLNGTPLYDVAGKAYQAMLDSYDPAKINAVVFLTDGVNDDGVVGDDEQQFTDLITSLRSGSEGAQSRPVRMFTISYGDGADTVTLKAISQATSAAHYDASNPATINQVFTAVISNF